MNIHESATTSQTVWLRMNPKNISIALSKIVSLSQWTVMPLPVAVLDLQLLQKTVRILFCDLSILSIYRDPQGCDIVATLSVAMISQSLRVAISFISATKILGFLSFFCDICQYRNKISDFFEHFLRYGKYRKKGQKGAKIFVALMSNITTQNLPSVTWSNI